MASVTANRLAKTYDRPGNSPLRVLQDVSFRAIDHEFICILGPSGCGKTTILNSLAGLVEHDGEIQLLGNSADAPPTIGYVFQTPRLLPWKTVGDNLEFVLRAWGVPEDKRTSIAEDWLKRVGLADFAGAYPHELSLGMQARVGLARALATNPDILLMDEPFSHVDEITARRLRLQLQAICAQTKQTVVFITHNPREAAFLADRIYVLSQIPARVTGELQANLPRPRIPESPEIADVVRQIYKMLESPEIDKEI